MFYFTLIIPVVLLIIAIRQYRRSEAQISTGRVMEVVEARTRFRVLMVLTYFSSIAILLYKVIE